MTLLLHTDEGLANLQDNYGNTALQIACSKAHKPTVKAFLVREESIVCHYLGYLICAFEVVMGGSSQLGHCCGDLKNSKKKLIL